MNDNIHEPGWLLKKLKSAAVEACENAHAIYSDFPVGAALITDDGSVYSGCNVENASYGLTMCAERNALALAVASGVKPGEPQAIVIYTPGDIAHTPCGGCRQVMQELMPGAAIVVSCCDSEQTRVWNLSQLIPDPFESP